MAVLLRPEPRRVAVASWCARRGLGAHTACFAVKALGTRAGTAFVHQPLLASKASSRARLLHPRPCRAEETLAAATPTLSAHATVHAGGAVLASRLAGRGREGPRGARLFLGATLHAEAARRAVGAGGLTCICLVRAIGALCARLALDRGREGGRRTL